MTGRRLLRTSPGARAAAALWLAAMVALALSAPAGAQAQGGGDAPTELWRTYPVDPHGGQAPIRAGETGEGRQSPVGAQRDPGATRGTDASPEGGAPAAEPGGDGAREPAVLVVAGVGVAVVLSGLLMLLALGRRVVGSADSVPMALAGASSPARPPQTAALARGSFRRRRRKDTRAPEPEAPPPPEVEAEPSVVRDLVDAATAAAPVRQEPDEPGERQPAEGARPGAAVAAHALGYGSRVAELVEGSDPAPRRDDAGKGPASDSPPSGSPPSDVEALRAKAHAGESAKELPRVDADALKRKARRPDAEKALDDTTRALRAAEKGQPPATDADVLRDKLARGASTTDEAAEEGQAREPGAPSAAPASPPEPSQWDVLPSQDVRRERQDESGFVLVRTGHPVLSKRRDIVLVVLASILSVAFGIAIALLLN